MKRRKTLIMIITIFAILLLGMFVKETKASELKGYMGVQTYRESGYGYRIKDRMPPSTGINVWKIVRYPHYVSSANPGTIDWSKSIYCVRAGVGFTANNKIVNYTNNYDMKQDKTTVLSIMNSILSSQGLTPEQISTYQENYNKIMWILDNLYLPAQSEQDQERAKIDRDTLLQKSGIEARYFDVITDDDIETTQQLAIWYFTNFDDNDYNKANFQTIYLGQNDNFMPLSDYGNSGEMRQHLMQVLFTYLINTANNNTSYESYTIAPITINKENVTCIEENNEYKFGPYKITKNSNLPYNFTFDFNTSDYTLKDKNGNTITDLKDTVSNANIGDTIEVYAVVPRSSGIQGDFEFNYSISYTNTTATFITTDATTMNNEQPLVTVNKEKKEDKDTIIIPIPKKEFDLSLRKFITQINGKDVGVSRQPTVDTTPLKNGQSTANYNHTKQPLSVKVGDIVTYKIRVYNEGELDGYVSEITDYLPEWLDFIPEDEENINYAWIISGDRSIKTTITAKDTEYSEMRDLLYQDRGDKGTLLSQYNGGDTLDYIDLQIKCKVNDKATKGNLITNIADISGMTDDTGTVITTDRDSTVGNVIIPSDEELQSYIGKDTNKTDLSDSNYYYKGQEDDDDFEKLIIDEFDLALRKFITGVNTDIVYDRVPVVSKDENGKLVYNHTKEPVGVKTGDIVTYTIRVFNEGSISGYATEIADDIPDGLEFLPEQQINLDYGWKMLDKNQNETQDPKEAVMIVTSHLADKLLHGYQSEEDIRDTNPEYRDVQVAFKVVKEASKTDDSLIINVAQISADSDDDIDSVPSRDDKYNFDGVNEDDIDYEPIKVTYFDLALRKFITGVDNIPVNNRYPELSYDETTGDIKYNHTKEPLEVENNNIITYTIRVYNEGTIAGYAEELKDNIPEGLEFIPDNSINTQYGWKMYKEIEAEDGSKEYEEVTNPEEATMITTDYLSKALEQEEGDNLIKPFDKNSALSTQEPLNPDYREVKVAFKVTEPNTSDRIIINHAEINKDSDDDIDSTPGEWIEGEDDQDIEKVKVKYFDLALKKWVTQAIISENKDTTIVETGHTGEENPEPIVKVEIQSNKINTISIKFKYKIKITNEGEIAGYAKEIKDYIPEGLKFVAEDNPLWIDLGNGMITTTQLENTLLQPGESATVEVILTWINGQDNMGLKVNTAEISKDYNDSHTHDIDSTPDNKVPGEDDIDDAPVLLAVKTGQVQIYFFLTGIILITLISGIILIKKFVL